MHGEESDLSFSRGTYKPYHPYIFPWPRQGAVLSVQAGFEPGYVSADRLPPQALAALLPTEPHRAQLSVQQSSVAVFRFATRSTHEGGRSVPGCQ